MKQVETNVIVVTCQIGTLSLRGFKVHVQLEMLVLKAMALTGHSLITEAKVLL